MADSVSRPDILSALKIPAEIRADAEAIIARSAGAVWQRPALSRVRRSLMSLSTLGALGRWDQFRVHVGMALDNGLSRLEICGVILARHLRGHARRRQRLPDRDGSLRSARRLAGTQIRRRGAAPPALGAPGSPGFPGLGHGFATTLPKVFRSARSSSAAGISARR